MPIICKVLLGVKENEKTSEGTGNPILNGETGDKLLLLFKIPRRSVNRTIGEHWWRVSY